MEEYFPELHSSGRKVKIELHVCNYPTKADLKNGRGVDTSNFAKMVDLANLKSDVDKLDVDKLTNALINLNNLKSKLDKLGVDKLVPVPIGCSKLSDVVKNGVVKKVLYNAKIKNIENKTPDITHVATNTTLNAKINEVKGEIPSSANLTTTVKNKIPNITNLATTSAFTAVENKTPNVSNIVKKTDYNKKFVKLKIKLLLMMIMVTILLLQNLIS